MRIRQIWRDYREHKLLFKCIMGNEFYDKGFFRTFMNPEEYHSQFGQDFFLSNVIFPQKNDGVFLDIGANHPTHINNSYHFEKKGWTGLAFEPQKHIADMWECRTTPCLNIALGACDDTIDFTESTGDYGTASARTGYVKDYEIKKSYKVSQRRLTDVLLERNISYVDFASIDVEGYEFDVLNGIDFNKIEIYCFIIENDEKGYPNLKLRKYMQEKGYFFAGRIYIDDVFIKYT